MMTRRRFTFWLGFGLFSLGEKLCLAGLDQLAAAAMDAAASDGQSESSPTPTHWTAAENNNWRWFEREEFRDGKWKLTGITTPVHKRTPERRADGEDYLSDELVPAELLQGSVEMKTELAPELRAEYERRTTHPKRRARHGRPPSKWLRSLNADELRLWLKTVEVPEAGVSGMSYWEHLTRDHSFDPEKIQGLAIDDQAKLHAAAHFGY